MNYMTYIPRIARGLMGGINDPVHVGAPFSLGVEFTGWWEDMSFRELPQVLAAIQSKLTASGYTRGLVRVYQLAGYLNPFVVAEGYSGREYGRASDLRDAILSVIASEYSGIDFGSVRFETTTYNPTTGQTQQSRTDTPEGSGPPPPPPGPGLLDQLAQSLGTTKDEAQMLMLGGGLLLAIALMKR
jgi:hypothetical protein